MIIVEKNEITSRNIREIRTGIEITTTMKAASTATRIISGAGRISNTTSTRTRNGRTIQIAKPTKQGTPTAIMVKNGKIPTNIETKTIGSDDSSFNCGTDAFEN